MTYFWDKQIQRADHLAKQSSGSSELLAGGPSESIEPAKQVKA